jgi:hypothetical protein
LKWDILWGEILPRLRSLEELKIAGAIYTFAAMRISLRGGLRGSMVCSGPFGDWRNLLSWIYGSAVTSGIYTDGRMAGGR